MNIGDLYWADLPTVNGHEQSGRRPVMIFQDNHYTQRLSTALIVPVTSAAAALRFPGTLVLPVTPQNGLKYDSILLVFQMRTLDIKRIHEYIGTVDPEKLLAVYRTFDELTARAK